jgi:predicted dehydrogenase
VIKALKVGIIGLGHLGRYHAEKVAQISLAGLGMTERGVELKAICDINEERLEEVSNLLLKGYGLKPFKTKNFEEVLPLVDAVIVATPTFTHYEIVKKALLEGKAVLVEKPLTADINEAKELIKLAEEKALILQVGYVERFQRVVEELCQRVKDPIFIEAHRISSFTERNLDIDVVLDLMVHDLDLLFLFKNPQDLEFIHAVGAPVFTEKPDIVNARLVFKDGTTCNLTASRISLSKQRKFRVFAKGAYFRVDTLEKSLVQVLVDQKNRDYRIERLHFPDDDPLLKEVLAFVEAVVGMAEPRAQAKETLASLEVALRIKAEVETNLKRLSVFS